jgi:glyoxylate reductase
MKVLASRRFPGPAFAELAEVEFLPAALPQGLGQRRPGVEALAVVSETVDERSLELLPELHLVANYGAGYDGIDVEACRRRGVAVTNTPGVLDAATADLAFALIMAARRRIVEADALIRARRWDSGWAEGQILGEDVSGATLGVVGLGRIGRAVARRARAFDMRLLYTQLRRLPAAEERRCGVEYRPLDELLTEAEIVTLHVPVTEDTRGFIDERRLRLMPDGACLVNTARGQIVEEAPLVDALVEGRLRAGPRCLRPRAARAGRAAGLAQRRSDAAHRQRHRANAGSDDARARRQHPGC